MRYRLKFFTVPAVLAVSLSLFAGALPSVVAASDAAPAPMSARVRQEFFQRVVKRLSRRKGRSLAASVLHPYLLTPARPSGTLHPRASSASSSPAIVRPAAPTVLPSSGAASSAPEVAGALTQIRLAVLRLVNAERAKVGAQPLTMNPLLERSAQAYAEDMQRRNFFAHKDPDGHNSLDRIRATGYLTPPCDCAWRYVTGENLGKGQQTPEQVVNDWMHSPSHRENMLKPDFKDIGIGYVGEYWVQNFGLVEAH